MDENKVKEGLKEFFCSELGIEESALEYDTPLFSEGIGLDSLDSLEIISYVDGEYGISMAGIPKEHFYNLNSIADYIVSHKA